MRRLIILSICCFCTQLLFAQIIVKPIKDSLVKEKAKVVFKNKNTNSVDLIATEIDTAITGILRKHTVDNNNEYTWSKIRSEATSILMQYYYKGKLIGIKPEQAFFIKIGTDTITAADIANHKIVMLYGIALVKPSEFSIKQIFAVMTR